MTSNIKRIGDIGELINEIEAEYQAGNIETILIGVVLKDGTFCTRVSPGKSLNMVGLSQYIAHDIMRGSEESEG